MYAVGGAKRHEIMKNRKPKVARSRRVGKSAKNKSNDGGIFRRIQDAIHEEDFITAKKLLDTVKEVIPPDKRPLEIEAVILILEAGYLTGQRQFETARKCLTRVLDIPAQKLDEQSPGYANYVKVAAWNCLATIEMREGPTEQTLGFLRDTLALAQEVGDEGTIGDTAFNIGSLLSSKGETDKAKEYWQIALDAYTKSGHQKQVNDCMHMLGIVPTLDGKATEESLDVLQAALAVAMNNQEHAAVSRIAGDLAYSYMLQFLDGSHDALAKARHLLDYVYYADHVLWENARMSEHSIGARLERAEQSFLNIETAISVAYFMKNITEAFGRSCYAKSRILRNTLEQRVTQLYEQYRHLSKSLKGKAAESVAVSTFPRLIDDIAEYYKCPIAVIDQFMLHNDRLFMSINISIPGKIGSAGMLISKWETQADNLTSTDTEQNFTLRGQKQGDKARLLMKRILADFESLSGVARYFVNIEARDTDVEQRKALMDATQSTLPALQTLGCWLFPKKLRELLRKEGVGHVFLSPDPRLFCLPWNALEFEPGNSIIDESWTLSLVHSPLHLYDAKKRMQEPISNGLVILSPDKEINNNRGGYQEIHYIQHHFPNSSAITNEHATHAEFKDALARSGWVHLRTHGKLSMNGTFVPKLYDALWEISFNLDACFSPVLVTTSCRTGETSSEGQDIFGMLEIAEQSNIRSVVAPVVSVDGDLASFWMDRFYEGLKIHRNIGKAVKYSCKAMKETFIHPTYWAPFILVGDSLAWPICP